MNETDTEKIETAALNPLEEEAHIPLETKEETETGGNLEELEYELPHMDELETDEEAEASFKTLARELQLTREQVKRIGDWANGKGLEKLRRAEEARERTKTAAFEALRNDWGANHEIKFVRAVKTAEKLAAGDENFRNFLEETGAGNDPRFIKTLNRIGEMISEDCLTFSQPQTSASFSGPMPVLNFSSMKETK